MGGSFFLCKVFTYNINQLGTIFKILYELITLVT